MVLRILHVVTYMGRGGLESMLMNYYRAVDRSIIQFDFLTHRGFKAEYDDEIEALGGRIFHMPRLNPFSPHYRKTLEEFFNSHPEYRIVHVHQDCLSGVVLQIADKCGVPNRIAHSHNSNQTKDWKYPIKLMFRPLIVPNATALFACGEEAGRWMFRTDDFHILNNAIDAKKYIYNPRKREEIRKAFGIDPEDLVIGHVGRFSPPKNHEFLIDVFSCIRKKRKAKLILVGDGKLRETIENKVNSLNLEADVIFTGIRDDVADIMQAMDVFVFPSFYEGMPVTLIEAQAAGLPCLISDKVPIECKITDLVSQLSLNLTDAEWGEKALLVAEYNRGIMYNKIRDAGFDINENAKRLTEYYFTLV